MSLPSILLNILAAVVIIILAFWALGLLIAFVPSVIVLILKLVVVIAVISWLVGMFL